MKTVLTLILGALSGIGLTIGVPAIADVTLNTPVSTSVTANGVRVKSLNITWLPNDETVLSGPFLMLDGGTPNGETTDLNVGVPPTSGAPIFGATGFFIDGGGSLSCTTARTAFLTTTADIKTKWEAVGNNCFN